MAFREVEKAPSQDRWWKPAEVGDYVEGNVYKFVKGDYGIQIELYLGYDEDEGEYILQGLPAHADLKRVYSNINVGDFIHVEVSEIIKAKSRTGNDKFIYKVLVDDDRFIEFPSEDENSTDDYYE